MNIPEKIYLHDLDNISWEDREDDLNITWSEYRIFNEDIEYTRSDIYHERLQNDLYYFFYFADEIRKSFPDIDMEDVVDEYIKKKRCINENV
jgi:hypothetical protein